MKIEQKSGIVARPQTIRIRRILRNDLTGKLTYETIMEPMLQIRESEHLSLIDVRKDISPAPGERRVQSGDLIYLTHIDVRKNIAADGQHETAVSWAEMPSFLLLQSCFLILSKRDILFELPPPIPAWKGGEPMGYLLSFLISVAAGVIANCICKWLDGDDNGNQPKD